MHQGLFRDVKLSMVLIAALLGVGHFKEDKSSNDFGSLDHQGQDNNDHHYEGHRENSVSAMVASMMDSGQVGGNLVDNKEFSLKEQEFSIHLDNSNKYKLHWSYNYSGNSIRFGLKINERINSRSSSPSSSSSSSSPSSLFSENGMDIFALGFSETGGVSLASTEFCIIWLDLRHQCHVQSAKTNSANLLQLIDESQSVCRLLNFSSSSSSSSTGDSNNNSRLSANGEADDDDKEWEGSSSASSWREHRKGRLRNNKRASNKAKHVRHYSSTYSSKEVDENQDEQEDKSLPELKIVFSRPLDICNGTSGYHYMIDNGTTHLIWFATRGPVLSMDGLNLTRLLEEEQEEKEALRVGGGKASRSFEWGLSRVQLISSSAEATFDLESSSGNLKGSPSYPSSSYSPDLSVGDNELEYQDGNLDQEEEVVNSHHDIKMDKFEVPPKETTYWCKLFKLPRRFIDRKYHITSYGPRVQAGNEHVVHHMELFNCANLNSNQEDQLEELIDSDDGWSGDCGDLRNRPKATLSCKKVIMAWAMGAKALKYPHQVGQSIGGPGYSPYVLLEVHYNNLGAKRGFIDSSGLTFHYTNKLRPFEAGILEVGLEYTDKYAIPPNLITPLAGYCVSECSRVGLVSSIPPSSSNVVSRFEKSIIDSSDHPDYRRHLKHYRKRRAKRDREPQKETSKDIKQEDGIYIFAAQLHTHLAGVASWTEHIREGKLLGELQRDDHYSPHFQEIRYLPKPIHFAPGDALIHYCLYDTRKRLNVTLGGEATSDEMCVTYIHYYPRQELEVCKSSVDSLALEGYFKYLHEEEGQQTSSKLKELSSSSLIDSFEELKGSPKNNVIVVNDNDEMIKTVSENYKSIEWTKRRSEQLIEFYSRAPLSIQCNKSNGDRFPGNWNGIEPTRIWSNFRPNISKPFEWAGEPRGHELVAYRGLGHRARHAQCARAH